jgi:hypothetical protein
VTWALPDSTPEAKTASTFPARAIKSYKGCASPTTLLAFLNGKVIVDRVPTILKFPSKVREVP